MMSLEKTGRREVDDRPEKGFILDRTRFLISDARRVSLINSRE